MKKTPKNIPTYYHFKGTPVYRDTTALPFKDGGKIYADKFNTKLKGDVLKAYQEHSKIFPALLNDKYDYDTQGFYQEVYNTNNGDIDAITKALTPGSPTAHVGTDKFKKPNHPTFSNESKYHIPFIRKGGSWEETPEGEVRFNATNRDIRNMINSDGSPLNYFKRAEDYDQNRVPDVSLYHHNNKLFAVGGPLNDKDINRKLLQSTYASPLGNMFREGGPFGEDKGAFDYAKSIYASQPGNYYRTGGQFPRPYSLPEDNFKQGGRNLHNSVYASSNAQYPAVYKLGGNINLVAGGEKHRVYIKESPTGVGEGVKGHVMVNHPTMDKGVWDTIDLTAKAGAKTIAQGIAATKQWHKEHPNAYRQGGSVLSMSNTPQLQGEGKDLTVPDNAYYYGKGGNLIRRADGGYSPRGLWDNIRANAGSGKKPTKEMLKQEKEINNNYKQGGTMNFKSNAAYKRWLGYGHASGEFAKTPGNQPVSIKGKSHKVEHSMGGNMYAAGGGIHIKPSHEGLFTKKANAAGMGVQAFASKVLNAPEGKYSGSTRKQANFAKNAGSWHHAMGGSLNSSFDNPGFKALPSEVQNKIKQNAMGSGGNIPLQTPMGNILPPGMAQNFSLGGMKSYASGGMLDNQLTEFTSGGRHEENPIGGIPQGFSPDGRVNLVEQGETKLNSADYVFSDTLKVTKDIALDYNLPNQDIGKTFAEASKRMNRPKSRRENDTIEEVAKERDLNNLMQAQEDFKQRDLQKDIDMMSEKHPEFMANMMQQGQLPEQNMEQVPQSISPMGMPQGQPVDASQVPPEMLAQMQGAQQGMPIMRMGGNMYMCGGKMYNFGGHTYANGGEVLRGIGAGAYGAGEGLLDTLTFGLTDPITDKGFDALSRLGNRTPEDIEREKMIRGFGNTAGAITGGVLSGGAATGSAISEGSEGLGEGLTNIKGTGQKFDNIVNGISMAGSMVGGLVGGNPADATENAVGNIAGDAEKVASKVPKFAETLMKAGKNETLQKVPGILDSVGSYMNANNMDASEMQDFRNQESATVPQQVRGYNLPPMPMKYGGYSAQAPWHNFPQYTPNYPGNAGPMYMGLGTNLFADGGMMTGGPGDPPTTQANPAYDVQMQEYIQSRPGGGKWGGVDYEGESIKEANLTRLLTPEELSIYHQHLLANQPYQYTKEFLPSKVWVPEIPKGMPTNYYSTPTNITDSYAGGFPEPLREIAIPPPAPAPAPTPEQLYYQTDVKSGERLSDWNPAGNRIYRLAAPDMTMNQELQLANPTTNWFDLQNQMYQQDVANQKAKEFDYRNTTLRNDPTAMEEWKTFKNQQLADAQVKGEKINVDDLYQNWAQGKFKEKFNNELSPSTIPTHATESGEKIIIPRRTGETNWEYEGKPYNYDPTLDQNTVYKVPMYKNGKVVPDQYLYQYQQQLHPTDPTQPIVQRNGGSMSKLNTMYSPDLTYSAKMGGHMYGYGGGIHNPLMPVPDFNYNKFEDGGKKRDWRNFKKEVNANIVNDQYNEDFGISPENYNTINTPYNANYYPLMNTGFAGIDNSMPNVVQPGQEAFGYPTSNTPTPWATAPIEESTVEMGPKNQEILVAEQALLNAESPEEYKAAQKAYQSAIQRADETLKDRNLNLNMDQGMLTGAAMAVPAAYNIGVGLFGKPEILNYKDYQVNPDITPYEYNINPQLTMANQTYAQAQEAARNAAVGGGNYLSNMQQLANSRNQTIGELYANKQNLDAAQKQAAQTANKQIQADNLTRRLGIEDFNRMSKAAKVAALQAGLVQTADMAKALEDKKVQTALIKSIAPDFANSFGYNTIGEQFLDFLKQKGISANGTSAETTGTTSEPAKK
jgi:hypothetical protein